MCFRKMDEFIGKGETFVKDRLVRQGLEKPVDFLKVCFLNFRYFFIACKQYKRQGELYFVYHCQNNHWREHCVNDYLAFRIQN